MVVSTQTLAPAPEAIKHSYEHNLSQPVRNEANGINYSLPSPLESFAQEAIDNAKTISDFLRSNDLPHPSFARDAPANAFLSAPDDVLAARSKLTEAALRLLQLTRGPQEYVPNLAVNVSSFLQMPQLTTLMDPGAICSMPAVAHPFLHLPAGATGRHDLIRCLGEPGKGVCKTIEDRDAHGNDFKPLFRARARRSVTHRDVGVAGHKPGTPRLGGFHDRHDRTFGQ